MVPVVCNWEMMGSAARRATQPRVIHKQRLHCEKVKSLLAEHKLDFCGASFSSTKVLFRYFNFLF